jgi:uncharacterized membrane protein YebE (DUF533 family)
MGAKLVDVLIIAVFADGRIDPQEAALLQSLLVHYPKLKDVSRESFDASQVKLKNRLQAGVSIKQIIEELGSAFTENEKNTAYALAYEICASNYELEVKERDLLQDMQRAWQIKRGVVNAIKTSIQLRYDI